MKKILVILIFQLSLLTCNIAHAGLGACHDGNGKVVKFESHANPAYYQITQNCVYFELGKNGITHSDYDLLAALLKIERRYLKWGLSGKPEEMTTQEKIISDQNALEAIKSAARADIDNLDISPKDLLTALIKRINARLPSGQAITKQEIIDQIKTDKGL